MAKRRSKRKATVLESLLEGGKLRRSKRKAALREDEHKIYGDDYGILPSDWSMVAASAIPKRVPLGFVCGYPVGNGGEQYGGSMFIRSAAADTLQGRAIQAVNEKWGGDIRQWEGRETIGIPVCKKKYSPFSFSIVSPDDESCDSSDDDSDSDCERRPKLGVKVNRMYGCKCHSDLRKAVIERHGLRTGWEPFGQWSLKKAQELARKETDRLNGRITRPVRSSPVSTNSVVSSDEGWTSSSDVEDRASTNSLPSMCNNGSCTWKVKAKYDNILTEIHGQSEADDEE